MIENKQNMTISNWFSQNRKILYWSLFIATFTITIKPIIAILLLTTCPEGMEWLSEIIPNSTYARYSPYAEAHLRILAPYEYFYGINYIVAGTICFVLFKICFFEKRLKLIQKIIILFYFILFYFILFYFIAAISIIQYMLITEMSDCYLHHTTWKK